MMQPVAPGENQSGQKSSEKPTDEPALPPIADDEVHAPADATDEAPPAPQDDDERQQQRPEPRKPPSDELRDKISARFSQGRTHKPGSQDDNADEEAPAPGASQDSDSEPPADDGAKPPIKGEGDQQQAERLTLKVFGKDHVKTVDEIAVLADMTLEEVRQNPERAVRFAQREMATAARLEEAKRIHREVTARQVSGDQDARPDRRAPDPERTEDGTGDRSGQQDRPSPTKGKVDFKKLAETLQIDDPEVAAAQLAEAFEQVAQTASASAKEAAAETVEQREVRRKATADFEQAGQSVKAFIDEHPDLAKNQYAGKIIAAGLHDEYREDLVRAMIAEGDDPDEAEQVVRQAPDAMVAEAHRKRRVSGDPNVRRIDKGMIEKAYERVSSVLGVKSNSSNNQDLSQQRIARKENLTPQPRRASVPPATNQPAPKPQTRSQAVAELAAARGQKGPSSPR